jgi:hypothetical protein
VEVSKNEGAEEREDIRQYVSELLLVTTSYDIYKKSFLGEVERNIVYSRKEVTERFDVFFRWGKLVT